MDIKKALKELIKDLESVRKKLDFKYALIGGLAVGLWGHIRATKDVDFILDINREQVKNFISDMEGRGYKCELRQGGLTDAVPLLVKMFIPEKKGGEISADILIATKEWENDMIRSSQKISFENKLLPVVTAEDLIILKLRAGGPVDMWDAKELLKILKPDIDIDALKSRAKQLRVNLKLEKILKEL